ncbi:hypothetical protein Gogos_008868 [Gossypium gossypioides]|uniref:Uncharacterized protein n=1 Tax=Gossypium gossypioides TaxID=34282 RepID=A0A7J9CCS4_GOSGO|nr:hypothetical protein [Gossypium gossypioides]
MIGTPQLSAVNENKEYLRKTIDECYKNFDHYQVQTGIDLLSQARYLLHDDVFKLWTDGRRILAYPKGNIQEDRDEESLKLLKKIADMEIEEFPSHIIEKIKNVWETWNSPPRLSLDSLHLDEIEEMNLNNMQEEEIQMQTTRSCNVEVIIKTMMMQAMMEATMTQAVMEAAINSKGFNLGKLAREGHGGQIGKFNALGYKGAAGSSGQLEKLGCVTVGSLGPNGDIALMSKRRKETLHANVLLDKQPSQSFGPSVALEGENPSLLDQAVKVGGSHQAQLVDVEEIIRAC